MRKSHLMIEDAKQRSFDSITITDSNNFTETVINLSLINLRSMTLSA
jgi:hypothetical protein